MEYDELVNSSEIVNRIAEMLDGDEGAFGKLTSDCNKQIVSYCNLNGDECYDDCSECDIAKDDILCEITNDFMSIFPTKRKEVDGVEYFVNCGQSIMQIEKMEDISTLLKKPKWFDELEKVEYLPDEKLDKYPYWKENRNIFLKDDELVEYRYLENYPMVIVCKNATYMVAPIME